MVAVYSKPGLSEAGFSVSIFCFFVPEDSADLILRFFELFFSFDFFDFFDFFSFLKEEGLETVSIATIFAQESLNKSKGGGKKEEGRRKNKKKPKEI